jgi:predicted anti-sigma-YlaC factor YlaD
MDEDAIQMACKEAARLMSESLDRGLSEADAGELKNHLTICLSCRNFGAQLSFLRKVAARYQQGGAPSVKPE